MNISQANLYEIIDAFSIRVRAGEGVFEIKERIEISNDEIYAQLDIEGLHLLETPDAPGPLCMYAIMRIGDLGIIAIANNGRLDRICLFDAAHPIPQFYLNGKDFPALLTHMQKDNWKSTFIAEIIEC